MKNSLESFSSTNQTALEKRSFPKTETFLANKAPALANNYRDEVGQPESCTLLTMAVVKLIIEEGGAPSVYFIRGGIVDSAGNRKSLIPKQYNGAITWGGHIVCENQGLIYDPMIGHPIPLSQYLEETFTEPVTGEIIVSSDKIQDFIDKK